MPSVGDVRMMVSKHGVEKRKVFSRLTMFLTGPNGERINQTRTFWKTVNLAL